MTIVKEYLDLTKKWKGEYGENTLVLMQVGSFFEAYGLLDKNNEIYGSDILKFANINDMAVSRKNICVGNDKVVMAGFGLPQLEKYIKKMQENGYTIIVYTQDTQTKNTTRSLNTIFSPGTYFSNDNKKLSNNISCIWLYYSKAVLKGNNKINVGISNIDIFTGKTSIFEFTQDYIHNPTTYDELERYISIYNPNECIIISNLDDNLINDIINYTSINSNKIHKINLDDKRENAIVQRAKNSEKQNYQEQTIKHFYSKKNHEIIVDRLKEYCIAIQSFVFLLDFVHTHNPNLVNSIAEPIIENHTERLILANHTLKQLNIVSDNRFTGKFSCVCNLLNNCITPMGKRKFEYNLLNPITNVDILEKSYNITAYLLEENQIWNEVRNILNDVRDIEKLRRKIYMQKITPKDFSVLYKNIIIIKDLYKKCSKDKKIKTYLEEFVDDYNNIHKNSLKINKEIDDFLDLKLCESIDDISCERLGNYDTEKLFFIKKDIYPDLDNSYKKSLDCKQQLSCVKNYLSDLVAKYEKNAKKGTGSDYIKIHEMAKTDCVLQITKRRSVILKGEIDKLKEDIVNIEYKSDYTKTNEVFEFDIKKIDFAVYGSNSSNLIVTSQQIRDLTSQINTSKGELIGKLELYYSKFINKFLENNLDNIVSFVSILDILQCKCYIANEYNYCKPEIIKCKKSFIEFTGIRHCLIEHLNTREVYIKNDLTLGKDDDNGDGILLYGTNAVGKTSIIKSIGISVIMAQAGLYVPADTFRYFPYNTIFTRILGNDNIFKGLSTFAVEMSELRSILELSDKNSLILGDELCSGTESDSALSIFVSGLESLHERRCTFLFATHFHEVVKYDEIIELKRLKMYHMSVLYDNVSKELIYDRKLKEGAGDSMYGLEVCKSLNLPDEFLERAHGLRIKYNKMYKNDLDKEVSRYNSKKVKDMCEICKMREGEEVHHLEYQKNARGGFINVNDFTINKNHLANLVNICSKCHDSIHKEDKKLKKVKRSSNYEVM